MKWPVLPLARLCQIETGRTPSRAHPEYFGGDNVWVTIADLNDETVSESKEHVTDNAVAKARMRPVPAGTVLLSYKLSLGKLGIAGTSLFTNEAIAALPPRPGIDLVSKYLFYALKTVDYLALCHGAVKGKCLNRASLNRIPVPYPPLSEQRRIVEILDQTDALRKKRAEADAKAARILPALFHRMFGNPMTNDKGWPTRRLNDVGQIVTGCTPSTKREEYYERGIRPWARPADCNGVILVRETEKRLSESGWDVARVVPESSVLVVCIGATLGKVALAGCDLAINQQINAVVPSQGIAPEFLYVQCVLLAERFRAHATKSTLPILNKSRFGAERIICPPSDLQEQFARAAHHVIRNLDIRNELGSRCNRLFNTLLHRAFTGDLTAKWREAHMKELLAEIEQQAKAMETPVVEKRVPKVKSKRHAGRMKKVKEKQS